MEHRRPILEFDGVSLAYVSGSSTVQALHRCDLQVHPGEWLAVMGANGSGKSSLAKLAAGILAPSAGRTLIDGVATTSERFGKTRLLVGYLSQHPEHHVVGLTVQEDVAFGPRAIGLTEEEVKARTDRWLQAVGLAGYGDRRTDELSGGQLQRIALAGVLALEPRLLILDEPTAFADPKMRTELVQLIRDYQVATQCTVVWITHFSDEASHASRIVVVNEGTIAFDGKPTKLWSMLDTLPKWGIGPPIASRARRLDQDVAQGEPNGALELGMSDLRFRYEIDGPDILQGIDLHVASGERVALIGPSGSGKSSLLQVAALLEHRYEGRLQVVGRSVPIAKGRRFRQSLRKHINDIQPDIALAFQQPESQLFGVKVQDDFEFGLRHLGVREAEWSERITQALSVVGLGSWVLKRSPFALSGGERRKVAFALCMAQRPRLALFDEPTAGLDYESRRQVTRAIRQASERFDMAVLFATHDEQLLEACADRVLSLRNGQIVDGGLENRFHESVSESVDSGGQGQPGRAYAALQRIDARLQIAFASLLALTIAAAQDWLGLVGASIVVGILSYITKLKARQVFPIVWGLLPFVIVATLFSMPQGNDQAIAGFQSGPAHGLFFGWRMFLVVVSVLWLTRLSSVGDLLHAMRTLCSPLKRLGVPVASLVAATLVGARMIPILAEEARKIYRAQVMRGVERVKGWRGRWLRLSSLSIPLTFAVLRRAELLGEALATRGFSGEVVGPVQPFVLRRREWTFIGLATTTLLFIVLLDSWGGRHL